MHLPSLELINDSHIYISGEVIVDPSAAIASGVLLQADPGSRLTIAAGVCIGQGSVLHAHQGTLAIEAGAIVGSNVLMIGQGKIGTNACIGALTTMINPSVASDELVPAHSLIGDGSRQVTLELGPAETPNGAAPTATPTPNQAAQAESKPDQPFDPSPGQSKAAASLTKPMTPVYGQAYLERIMIAMFPHRQPLDDASPPQPP